MNKKQLQTQIKLAADTIEAQAAEIEALRVKVAQVEADKVKAVKTASEKQDGVVKLAADKAAPLAKAAADKLYEKGMFSTTENRDKFAAKIANDHSEALSALLKAGDYVETAQKVGSVVESTDSIETADDVWNKHAAAALARTPGHSAR